MHDGRGKAYRKGVARVRLFPVGIISGGNYFEKMVKNLLNSELKKIAKTS